VIQCPCNWLSYSRLSAGDNACSGGTFLCKPGSCNDVAALILMIPESAGQWLPRLVGDIGAEWIGVPVLINNLRENQPHRHPGCSNPKQGRYEAGPPGVCVVSGAVPWLPLPRSDPMQENGHVSPLLIACRASHSQYKGLQAGHRSGRRG
jgi:hypothetical protein